MSTEDTSRVTRIDAEGLDQAAQVAGTGAEVDPVDPLESMAYAAEKASERDRLWFEAHPGATMYYRKPVEGEFGRGYYGPNARVRVTQMGSGLRARQPLGDIVVTDPETVAVLAEVPELPLGWAEALKVMQTKDQES